MTTIRSTDTWYVGALFLDEDGDGVTGLSPVLVIRHAADGDFWTGSGYQASPAELAMGEVSAANAPGEYQYAFAAHAARKSGQHMLTAFAASGGSPYPAAVVEPVLDGVIHVGGWVDNLDAPVSRVTRRSSGDFTLETPIAQVDLETPDTTVVVEVEIEEVA